jgi:hypothetical protein
MIITIKEIPMLHLIIAVCLVHLKVGFPLWQIYQALKMDLTF